MELQRNFFYTFYVIFIFFIVSSNADEVTVKTNDEFYSAITNIKSNRTIIIDGDLSDLKNIDISIKNSISLIIKGINKEASILKFENNNLGLSISNIDSFEMSNISFHGNLNLNKLNNIYLLEMNHIGSININDITKNGIILMKDYLFTPNIDQLNTSSINININGQMVIEDSKFTANIGCTDSLIKYIGNEENESKLSIKNCLFDCNNLVKAITAQSGNITIENSEFFDGFTKESGGFVSISNSYVYIKNCEFKHSLSEKFGGVFYLLNNLYFEITDINVQNSIANSEGGIFYINSDDIEKINLLENITAVNYSNNCGVGAVISSNNYSNIQISNFKGEGFGCTYSTCCLFSINDHSRIEIENSDINNITITTYGMLFCIASNKNYEVKAYLKGNNCTFTNLYQHLTESAALIWNEAGIIDFSNIRFENIDSEHLDLIVAMSKSYANFTNIEIINLSNMLDSSGINIKRN
eukprot:jgi/Orpsp1_1/1175446/evm.model.c7180000053915.1